MPSSPNYVRDYKREKETARQRGENKDEIERQRVRRALDKKGVNRDGLDVAHIKPARSGGHVTPTSGWTLMNDNKNQRDNGHHKGEKKGVKK